ncbi:MULTISPECIES: sensor histidine kinase [unclassified Streptomyces]|uniref:sensor histidine kinase n=1 Tax=unclassified Streptomyces TaxID=2593676 RepID=UPI0004BDFA3A|nr:MULTISPECIES: sensor histidine kinase [unclassified Streptomyces]
MSARTGEIEKTGRNLGGSAEMILRGVALTGLALYEGLLLLWVSLVVCLCFVGIGIPLLPGALNAVRRDARTQRGLAGEWSGVRVEASYLPEPAGAPGAVWKRAHRMLGDSATWRDLLWTLVNPLVGPLLALLPAAAVLGGLWGLSLPFVWDGLPESWNSVWFMFIPVDSQGTAILAAALGLVEIVAGLALLPRLMLPLHGRWVRLMLGSTRAALSSRVEHLAGTRSDAMDMNATELRRIERDLHDGAQVRLVALGMTLSAAESMVERNPEAVRALLAEAKENSTKALNELRDLVHGVHPPLLADRGLVDAVRTLTLELPMRIHVTGSVPGRLPAPVESAAYFAVAELLSNVTKHARASEATVDIRYCDRSLRVAVHDDGVGGADTRKGSGLAGVERRLAAFDGLLVVTSPLGGPTSAAFEIACALTGDPAAGAPAN